MTVSRRSQGEEWRKQFTTGLDEPQKSQETKLIQCVLSRKDILTPPVVVGNSRGVGKEILTRLVSRSQHKALILSQVYAVVSTDVEGPRELRGLEDSG